MVLLLAVVVLSLLLVVFTYEIITTRVAAVDAPTLVKAAAAPAPPAAALPDRRSQVPTFPARGGGQFGRPGGAAAPLTGPAPRKRTREASARPQSRGVAALAIGGLAAGLIGGWMLYRSAPGAAACAHQMIQVCSQGFVVLTRSQLSGAAIAVAGILAVVVASVLAAR
jgi:hypothetical protein